MLYMYVLTEPLLIKVDLFHLHGNRNSTFKLCQTFVKSVKLVITGLASGENHAVRLIFPLCETNKKRINNEKS
jgi:hypothetical protein